MFFNPRDLLIFGLVTRGLRKPFAIGDLTVYPKYDLRSYLSGYDPDDVEFIIDSDTKYACYAPDASSEPHLFSPIVQDHCLIPFRLFKPGWLSAIPVMPVTRFGGMEMRSELGSLKQLFGQVWAEPVHYEIGKADIRPIQAIYRKLAAMPKGYTELAIRRFSRSYEYYYHSKYAGASELDDCVVDLVIALESITSRRGERVRRGITRRTVLLLGKGLSEEERKDLERRVKGFYDHRCNIVHGEDRDVISEVDYEERFNNAEDLRALVRDSLNACIELLNKPGLQVYKSPGKRKTLAEIIDSECRT